MCCYLNRSLRSLLLLGNKRDRIETFKYSVQNAEAYPGGKGVMPQSSIEWIFLTKKTGFVET